MAWRNCASLGSAPRSGSRTSSASSLPLQLSEAGSPGSSPSAIVAPCSAIAAVDQPDPTLPDRAPPASPSAAILLAQHLHEPPPGHDRPAELQQEESILLLVGGQHGEDR